MIAIAGTACIAGINMISHHDVQLHRSYGPAAIMGNITLLIMHIDNAIMVSGHMLHLQGFQLMYATRCLAMPDLCTASCKFAAVGWTAGLIGAIKCMQA